MSGIEKKIYIHHNYNKNQIKQVLLENNDYDSIPTPNVGEDKGLIYFDTLLERVLVWNGNVWKLVKYLDDRDYMDFSDVLVDDIWVESNLIPTVYATASTSTIVQYSTASTTYVPNSYSFNMNLAPTERKRTVPDRYGVFYAPVLKSQLGNTVSTSAGWVLQGDVVTFNKGFPYNLLDPVDDSNPPIVEYWKYTGRLGSFNFIGGATNIMEVTGVVSPIISVPSVVRVDNIISVTINGVLIYRYSYTTGSLTIDTANLGYSLESDDIIRIELNKEVPGSQHIGY
jgi:hypothetical protein